MNCCKRFISLALIVLMIAGLALNGHALGYALSGNVISYGDAAVQTVLQLIPEGDSDARIEKTVSGNQTAYQLANIPSGNYTLSVQKEGHVTRIYPVSIDSSNATLDVKICLLGDVNCNGKINMGDVSTAYAHSKRTAVITDSYKLACGDLNGDGKINLGDTSRVYAISKGSYKPAVKEVTLSVWTPSNDQAGDNSWLAQMQASFEKAHPEYKITWENGICHEGDAGSFVGEDPEGAADVYMVANDQIGYLINAGAVQPLRGKYADQVVADNSQTMVNSVTYTDGNIYGFPMTNNTWFMYYNKNTYSAEDVKSLDTMLTKGNVAFPWATAWYSGTFFLANGGAIFGDQGIDATAGIQFGKNNGGYEAALKMVQLASNLHLIDDFGGRGYQGFIDGSVDAYFSGSWDYSSLTEALGDNLGIAQLPTVEIGGVQKQMKAFAGSKAVVVNPHADELELATAFAAHLATPEAQKLRYEYNNTIPAASSLVSDPVISQNPVALAEINNITHASTVQPIIPEMAYYWNPVGKFGGLIANGEITEDNYPEYVDQLLAELNEEIIDDGTVTLSVWATDEDLSDGGWMEVMQKAFAAEHPELNIRWDNSSCAEGDAGSMVSSDPENAADVYIFANDQLGTLVNAGAIMELTGDYLDQVIAYNSQTLINTVTHTDDGVYGFPISNNTWFMYYNKDVFSEEDVKSLDTMLQKGRVAFPWNVAWYSGTFFLANGGTIFGEKGNDPSAGIQFGKDNGGYEAALKMIQLAANSNLKAQESSYAPQEMANGTIDAFFSGSWDYPNLYSQMGDKVGAVQLPTVEINGVQKQMKSFAGSKAVAANPYADHPELAIAFAAFLSTPDAQMLRYQMRGVIPCAESLANDPVIQENPVAVAEINTMNSTSVVQPCIPEMINYWSPVGDFGASIASGDINKSNYLHYVDVLMAQLNDEEYDGGEDFPTDAITLSVWTPAEDQVEGGWLETIQEAFAAEHPELNINWQNGICHEGDASSMVAFDPAAAADVYMFAHDQLNTLVDAGAVKVLSGDYLKQVLNDNSQTMINTVTYTNDCVYGFPVANNTWFMYYNKDIFSEEDVKSLDTMLSKGKVTFDLCNAWYNSSLFLANGGIMFGENGNDASAGIQFGKYNGGYDAALKMIQLAQNPNMINNTNGQGYEYFCDGDVGAYFSGSWDYARLHEQLGDKLGAVQLPTIEIGGEQRQMKAFAGSKAIAINPHSAEPELAAEFAAYLASAESQMVRYQLRGIIPAAATLVTNPELQNDMLALAEISNINNAGVVQPYINEMNNYWTPMGNFGSSIINGEIHEGNYQVAVDHLVFAINNDEPNSGGSQITNVYYSSGDMSDGVTLRIHYYRPDGDYEGWNLWLWDDSDVESTSFEPPYQLQEIDGEMVCTVKIKPATNTVGYIVRYLDWIDKDIYEDQFIDLTGIIDGTVDVYIQSGVKGHTIILNDDVVTGVTFQSLEYRHDTQQLILALSSVPEGSLNAALTDSNGNITITQVARIGSYFYLTLESPLAPDSYTLSYNGGTVLFDII